MARTLPKTFKRIGMMGSRPEEAAFRTINLIFFLMSIFFTIIYFIVASTHETAGGGEDFIKTGLTDNLIAVSALSVVLLIMEFYFSLSSTLKMLRLAAVVALFVFIGLSIPKAQDLGASIPTATGAGQTLVYTFASLALGFAGVAALVNGLEVIKNYGY